MPNETQSGGDGILADQGSQDFGSLTGSTPNQNTQRTQQSQQTQAPAQQNIGGAQEQQQEGVINMRRARPGAVTDDGQGLTAEGQPTQQGTGQTQQGQGASTQTAATQPTPDLAAIIRSTVDATAAAMRPHPGQQTQQTVAPQQLTAAEFDQRYGIMRPTEEMVTHLIGQDPKRAVAVLNTLFQSNLSASLRMANDVLEAKLAQMSAKFEPHVKSWTDHQQQVASERAEQQFFIDHKDLANERELVMEMKDAFLAKVQAGQIRFNTQSEANLAVANATRAILKRFNSGGGQTQTGQSQNQQGGGNGGQTTAPASRQMSAASSAGRTGTGQAAARSVVDEVFGADAR